MNDQSTPNQNDILVTAFYNITQGYIEEQNTVLFSDVLQGQLIGDVRDTPNPPFAFTVPVFSTTTHPAFPRKQVLLSMEGTISDGEGMTVYVSFVFVIDTPSEKNELSPLSVTDLLSRINTTKSGSVGYVEVESMLRTIFEDYLHVLKDVVVQVQTKEFGIAPLNNRSLLVKTPGFGLDFSLVYFRGKFYKV